MDAKENEKIGGKLQSLERKRKASISNDAVRRAKPDAKPYEIRDTKLTGLLLRVQPSGIMTYYYEYERSKRIKIGRSPAITPDQAREIARGVEAQRLTTGQDPIERKKRIQAENYLQFLDEIYRPWLRLNLVHGDYAYGTLTKGFNELHSLNIREITPGVIEKWRTRRLQEDIDPNTINRQLSDLKACLRRAKDIWDLQISDKLDKVKPCKIDRSPKVRYLNASEEKRLRQALNDRVEAIRSRCESGNQWRAKRNYSLLTELNAHSFIDHLKPAVLLSLNTGLRRGELLKLKWEDIHFEESNLTVVGKTSKTGKTRHIKLNAEARSILKELKKYSIQSPIKSLYVFNDSKGQPLHDMRTSWESVLKRAGITNFRWHDMRHHFASMLIKEGVDLYVVKELLGHSDYKMTERYAHLAPKAKQDAVDRLVQRRKTAAG